MPIKPRLFTVVCEDCHWKKTVAPRSDALAVLKEDAVGHPRFRTFIT